MLAILQTYLQDKGDGSLTNLHITMDEKYDIVAKERALDWPGEGYLTLSPSKEALKQFHDMSFDGDLMPRLVKLELKRALMEALDRQKDFKGKIAELLILRHCLLGLQRI